MGLHAESQREEGLRLQIHRYWARTKGKKNNEASNAKFLGYLVGLAQHDGTDLGFRVQPEYATGAA